MSGFHAILAQDVGNWVSWLSEAGGWAVAVAVAWYLLLITKEHREDRKQWVEKTEQAVAIHAAALDAQRKEMLASLKQEQENCLTQTSQYMESLSQALEYERKSRASSDPG